MYIKPEYSSISSKNIQFHNDNDVVTGNLHGTWTSDTTFTTSDRRLKTKIAPLYKKMIRDYSTRVPQNELFQLDTIPAKDQATMATLRELRPVSFKYKNTPEAKYSRFGFIAQEIEKVMPDVVHTNPKDGFKYVTLQDLIAVITLGLQSVDSISAKLETEIDRLIAKERDEYNDLAPQLEYLENLLDVLADEDLQIVGLDQNTLPERFRTGRNETEIALIGDDPFEGIGGDDAEIFA
jgi:hypothetical protein